MLIKNGISKIHVFKNILLLSTFFVNLTVWGGVHIIQLFSSTFIISKEIKKPRNSTLRRPKPHKFAGLVTVTVAVVVGGVMVVRGILVLIVAIIALLL